MFGDPLDKQFSQSLLDAARKINDKTVADAKTAKEEKERLEAEQPQDGIGQYDEGRSFLKGPQKKHPDLNSSVLDKMVADVSTSGKEHRKRIAALAIMRKTETPKSDK